MEVPSSATSCFLCSQTTIVLFSSVHNALWTFSLWNSLLGFFGWPNLAPLASAGVGSCSYFPLPPQSLLWICRNSIWVCVVLCLKKNVVHGLLRGQLSFKFFCSSNGCSHSPTPPFFKSCGLVLGMYHLHWNIHFRGQKPNSCSVCLFPSLFPADTCLGSRFQNSKKEAQTLWSEI